MSIYSRVISICGTRLQNGGATAAFVFALLSGQEIQGQITTFNVATLLTKPAPSLSTVVARNSNSTSLYGSSSVEGNQDGSGVRPSTAIITQTAPGSTAAVTNRGTGGAYFDSTANNVIDKLTTYPDYGSEIIQFDNNGYYAGANYGGPETRRVSFINNAISAIPSGVKSGRRWLAFAGTDTGFSFVTVRADKMRRLLWADYPGQVINEAETFAFAPPADATDIGDQASATFPRSYQITDRSHLNGKGYTYRASKIETRFAEAVNGGPAFFANYPYYSNASTAQTNGGAVLQLQYIGDLTGTTLSLVNLDGTPNTDFSIDATATVTRASGTVIRAGRTDLMVKVSRAGITPRYDQLSIGVGNLDGSIGEMTLDGYGWGLLETNDNKGTAAAPSFTTASRQYAGLAATSTEVSRVIMVSAAAASDGSQIEFGSTPRGGYIRRLATGAFRVRYNNDSAASIGQVSGGATNATGRVNSADGRRIIYYSANVALGRQRLMIVDYTTRNTVYDSGSVATAGNEIALHNLASNADLLTYGNGTGGLMSVANGWKGVRGIDWEAAKEIDFSVAANRNLFYPAGGGVATFTASDGGHSGDGRSVIVQAGGTGSNAGVTVTPHWMQDGNASEFMAGRNRGTGGDFTYLRIPDATTPGNGRGIAITN